MHFMCFKPHFSHKITIPVINKKLKFAENFDKIHDKSNLYNTGL